MAVMPMKLIIATITACISLCGPVFAEDDQAAAKKLRFRYEAGAKYRIITEVNEDVLLNGAFSHRSNILNKVAVETAEVKGGSGRLSCEFQTSDSVQGMYNSYVLREDYHSDFWRDELGVFTIDPKYFMPVVRNVPRFPVHAVKPGDTWNGEAEEVHDFRRGYGIPEAFHFPVKVNYTYLRDEVKEGVRTAVLKAEYVTFHQVKYNAAPARPVPYKITGTSVQTFWWDAAAGQFHSYHEEFDYVFLLSNASHVEYKGTADGRLLKSAALQRDKVADDLNKKIKEDKIADTEARKDKNGVTIVMENVQFPPNSPELTDAEKEKLSRIAKLLKQYPDRDLLITGHTARVGDERTSQVLSEQRAMAVSDFLIKNGARKKNQVMTQGKGSREPAADNSTEAGRRRNRRVEITILEN
jgi:outer membrane protein OmpA-like peptidoglycan-associated protein